MGHPYVSHKTHFIALVARPFFWLIKNDFLWFKLFTKHWLTCFNCRSEQFKKCRKFHVDLINVFIWLFLFLMLRGATKYFALSLLAEFFFIPVSCLNVFLYFYLTHGRIIQKLCSRLNLFINQLLIIKPFSIKNNWVLPYWSELSD